MASFLLDHNVLPHLGNVLAGRGHAVLRAQEARLGGAGDSEILQFAGGLGLTLLSSDNDFIDLHRTTTIRHTGIILIPPLPQEPRRHVSMMAEHVDRLVNSGHPIENELYRFRAIGGWQRWDLDGAWIDL